MTTEEKKEWLEQAAAEELLSQYVSLVRTDDYGCNREDIKLTKDEILKRQEDTYRVTEAKAILRVLIESEEEKAALAGDDGERYKEIAAAYRRALGLLENDNYRRMMYDGYAKTPQAH